MILHPATLALLCSSLLTGFMALHAGWHGVRILRRWEMGSGSELQLSLERRTYLVSTLVSVACAVQLCSLFLFIYTADHLHGLFTGAMCAAGTLNANGFGYPVLLLKVANFLLAGSWLVINHADSRGYDYPLIRAKYRLLLVIAPLLLVEAFLLFAYVRGLHADVITSCCGSLFGREKPGLAGDLASLPPGPMVAAFYGGMGATVALGIRHWRTGRGGLPFAAVSTLAFGVAAASLVSFICLYVYELPTHHCPFCLLQKEYGYVGYLLYATLLGGGVAGLGTGILDRFRSRGSMARVIPHLQRRLVAVTLLLYLAFTLIVTYRMLATPFTLLR
ncbi:MAG TPA: hypothetical protein VL949_00315 [Geobacteraceae bacterium]|nr:hypothetical protein [Geobacteraceae bacterium]